MPATLADRSARFEKQCLDSGLHVRMLVAATYLIILSSSLATRLLQNLLRRHDTQHNDTKHNGIQHNNK
jgi:hypothetical protein